MDMTSPYTEMWRRAGAVDRMMCLALILCALAGFASVPTSSRILFAGNYDVPRSVQEFAWRVIETRCNYQAYEREQRSFWAFRARSKRVDANVVYSIDILSELTWKKTDPPALIEMIIVDDGRVRLAALASSFVVCAPSP